MMLIGISWDKTCSWQPWGTTKYKLEEANPCLRRPSLSCPPLDHSTYLRLTGRCGISAVWRSRGTSILTNREVSWRSPSWADVDTPAGNSQTLSCKARIRTCRWTGEWESAHPWPQQLRCNINHSFKSQICRKLHLEEFLCSQMQVSKHLALEQTCRVLAAVHVAAAINWVVRLPTLNEWGEDDVYR